MSKVIVISFDRWQVGFLGLYGNPWVDTPALDEFAVGAAVFDQHFADDLSDDAVQHAWWTGRSQFPLSPEQQGREPGWLSLLDKQGILSALLHDPAARVPLDPSHFSSARAISLDDVVGLHFEEAAPRFVMTAVQRIRKMEQQPERQELFWIHAGGLPVDVHSLAYDDLYAEDTPGTPARAARTQEVEPEQDLADDDVELEDELEADQDSSDAATETEEDDELIVFPPRFWRRARSSPRELADASLRGAGWDSRPTVSTHSAPSATHTVAAVDWQLRRDLYSAQVTQWDAWVGKILEAARKLAQSTPVMIVFTAAAGEHLGEHSDLQESPVLFEESIHVPLIIQIPHSDPFAGRRLQLTTAADLPATILEWFQVPVPEATVLDGISLLPAIQKDQPLDREYVLLGSRTHQGVRTKDFYYRQDVAQGLDGESIFVKPDDRWDVDDMLRQLPDAAESLREKWRLSAERIRERAQ